MIWSRDIPGHCHRGRSRKPAGNTSGSPTKPPRLQERYGVGDCDYDTGGDDANASGDTHGAATQSAGSQAGIDALPVAEAAEALTGYVNVTVDVAAVRSVDTDGGTMVKAALKDTTGAIDAVAWDRPLRADLADAEGESVLIKFAEVNEYEGRRELSLTENVAEIERVEAGTGYTQHPATAGGQQGRLADAAAALTDGGADGESDAERHERLGSLARKHSVKTIEGVETDDSSAALADVIDALDAAIGECQRKIESGRMTDTEKERARQGWHQSLAKLANAYRLLSKDKQLDEMAERVERLEDELPESATEQFRVR